MFKEFEILYRHVVYGMRHDEDPAEKLNIEWPDKDYNVLITEGERICRLPADLRGKTFKSEERAGSSSMCRKEFKTTRELVKHIHSPDHQFVVVDFDEESARALDFKIMESADKIHVSKTGFRRILKTANIASVGQVTQVVGNDDPVEPPKYRTIIESFSDPHAARRPTSANIREVQSLYKTAKPYTTADGRLRIEVPYINNERTIINATAMTDAYRNLVLQDKTYGKYWACAGCKRASDEPSLRVCFSFSVACEVWPWFGFEKGDELYYGFDINSYDLSQLEGSSKIRRCIVGGRIKD